ncbi:hypothetical protein ACOSQ4_022520 [Xanthoceras sorbifolium]
MQYMQNYNYQQNNPYLSIYNSRWSNHAEFSWSNQQEKKSSVKDLTFAFMSKQDALMLKMDTWMDTTLEIKKLVEQPIGVDQVEMEVSKSLSHGDEAPTSQEPPDSFIVHAVKEDDNHKLADGALWLDSSLLPLYESTLYLEELVKGKPKPPPLFKQPPHLGPEKLPSHLRYAWLEE